MSSYEADFYTWTMQQAQLLKSHQFDEIDLDNIIEEIESMGRSEKRALESRLVVLIQHLLKWHYQPTRRGRSWELTIKGQRKDFLKILRDNPGLKPSLDQCLMDAYESAVIKAAQETGLEENSFPECCPWALEQIIGDAFYPD